MTATEGDRLYFRVYYALIGLTVLTVAASRIDVGRPGNIGLAVLIAAAKATVVGLFFMHLKHEHGEGRKWIYLSVFFPLLLFVLLVTLLIPDIGLRDMAQN